MDWISGYRLPQGTDLEGAAGGAAPAAAGNSSGAGAVNALQPPPTSPLMAGAWGGVKQEALSPVNTPLNTTTTISTPGSIKGRLLIAATSY